MSNLESTIASFPRDIFTLNFKYYLPHCFFFYQQKTYILEEGKVPSSTQEVDKRNQPNKKQKIISLIAIPEHVVSWVSFQVDGQMGPCSELDVIEWLCSKS